jgi:tetratricopeptide (TPR) repeat protein
VPGRFSRLDDMRLLERDAQLAWLAELREQASRGRGALVLIEGAPGIGKTALWRVACAQAQRAGAMVLRGRCGEHEQSAPFAVLRECFSEVLSDQSDPLLAGAARHAAPALGLACAEPDEGGMFAAVHGLYWLLGNLAARGPLVLGLDDVQWADEATARWLEYIVPRLPELSVLLLLTVRDGELAARDTVARALSASADIERVRPDVLSKSAVANLLAHALSGQLESGFTTACHRATGGNPLLLRALISDLRSASAAHYTASIEALDGLEAEHVGGLVLPRIHRRGDSAVRVARAIAVLGEATELRDAATVAELSMFVASVARDQLVRDDVLQHGARLAFVHPLVRAAVYGELGLGERSRLHRLAADRMHHAGARAEDVARHLLKRRAGGRRLGVRAAAGGCIECGQGGSAGGGDCDAPARSPRTSATGGAVRCLAHDRFRRRASAIPIPPDGSDWLTIAGPESWAFWLVAVVGLAGRPAQWLAWADRALDTARQAGSLVGFEVASYHRALANLMLGNVLEAEADAQGALEIGSQYSWGLVRSYRYAAAIRALTERADLATAESIATQLERELSGSELSLFDLPFLEFKARLHLARGRVRQALDSFLALRDVLPAEWTSSSFVAWRPGAALAYHALGDTSVALALAAQEVELADAFGAAHVRGIALRTRGLVRGGDAGIADVEQALELLETAGTWLEHGWALHALGVLLRRQRRPPRGTRAAARRSRLRRAFRCGAAPPNGDGRAARRWRQASTRAALGRRSTHCPRAARRRTRCPGLQQHRYRPAAVHHLQDCRFPPWARLSEA